MTVQHFSARNALGLVSAVCVLLAATLARGQTQAGSSKPDVGARPLLALDTLEHWASFISPSADELQWKEIPWRESFWKAIHEGQIHGKPVLLWAMNGHPLGCT